MQRRLLFAVSLALFLSGAGWEWIQHLDQAGRASDALLRIKTDLIVIHGLSAMTFVFLLGTLLMSHVRRAWHARKNRVNGALFLAAVSLLTLSGYALYYLADETWRSATSRFHFWLGFAAPILLFWHIIAGRRAAKQGARFASSGGISAS